MASSTFSDAEMAQTLEARGWVNVWDIYWVRMVDGRPATLGYSTEDAFELATREAPPHRFHQPPPSAIYSAAVSDSRVASACTRESEAIK
jgi:hypothetical protein